MDGDCWKKSPDIGNPVGRALVKELEKLSLITVPDLFKFSAERNGNQPCMGTRSIIIRNHEEVKGKMFEKMELGNYSWRTYGDVHKDVHSVSSSLLSLDIQPKTRIAMFAETRADWYTFAVGAMHAGMTIVTLYTNLHDASIVHGINETEVETVVTSFELLPRLSKLLHECCHVRRIIVFEDQLEGIGNAEKVPTSVRVIPYSDFCKLGKNDQTRNIQSPKPDDIAIIMYTSGSTGNPKGVQLSHRNIYSAITSYIVQSHATQGDVYLAYLPLAHVMELGTESALLILGVGIAYSSPHTLTNNSPKVMKGTLGDARVARPTCLSAVPLILDRIIKGVVSNVERQGKFKTKLFSESLRYKQSINGDAGVISKLLDAVIFSKVKAELGGRLKMFVAGGAPLSIRTHKIIKAMFGCSMQIAYGLTETSACATSMDIDDATLGHCGPPNPGTIIKLESWEEGGYKTTDTPRPRGEVIIGGDCVAFGYYKMPEENKANFFEKDGTRWFRTGDIGEFDENGCLYIIDRMKDLVKLQHGEYVSLGSVESVLKTHSSVDNICMFADSSRNNTVAVVVPSSDYLRKIASTVSKSESCSSYEDLCNDPGIIEAVLVELQTHGRNQKLSRIEIPTALYLSSEAWTPDNGLVTAALKLRRKPITKQYSDQIAALYTNTG